MRAESEKPIPTVAVLYFQDLGPSPELAPLRKALTQMLITDLSRLEGLRVVQRERIEGFVKETAIGEAGLASPETAVLVGHALEADYVVQGTFSASSKQITVEVKVGSRAGPLPLPSPTFSRATEELMQLEQDIVSAVTKGLGIEPVLKAAPKPVEGVPSPGLAVMDFQNLSASGGLDPLQPALSDLLCATLSQIPQVTLVERTKLKEVMKELNLTATGLVDAKTAAKLGRLVGAQRMLVSSFVEVGGVLRFDSHLVDTEGGQLLGVASASGPKDRYATLIAELAKQVVAALSLTVPPTGEQPMKAEAPTQSWEALTYLQQGREWANWGQTEKAIDSWLQCVYLEPRCYAALVHIMEYGWPRGDQFVRDAAERIIGASSSSSEKRWEAVGAFESLIGLARDPSERLAIYDRAIRSNIPDGGKAYLFYWKVLGLQASGKVTTDELLAMYQQVLDYPVEENPMLFSTAERMAELLIQQNKAEEATSVLLKVAESRAAEGRIDSTDWAEGVPKFLPFALQYREFESAQKLLELCERSLPTDSTNNGWVDKMRGQIYEAEGKWDAAMESYERFADLRAVRDDGRGDFGMMEPTFWAMLRIGDLYAAKGNVNRAIENYQRVLRDSGGSDWYPTCAAVEEAARRLRQLGGSSPFLPGYHSDYILTQHMGSGIVTLGENGYTLRRFDWFPPHNSPEMLAPYQVAIFEWPWYGEAWWVTQAWLNFIRRGGGVFLGLPSWVRRSAAAPLRDYLGIEPSQEHPETLISVTPLNGPHPLAKEFASVSVPSGMILQEEYGLGRVLVARFRSSLVERREDFVLPAFGWLSQKEPDGEKADLVTRFRAVSDRWARKDHLGAIEALTDLRAAYAGTEWDELASYTIGEILQYSLRNYDQARQQFQQVFTNFPKGHLALAAHMAAVDCAEAGGADEWYLLNHYAQVSELGADTEIGATALLKVGFIHILAGRLHEGISVMRRLANDCPDGFAKNNALCALGYCYEKTGQTADALRTYQAILDSTVDGQHGPFDEPSYSEYLPEAWKMGGAASGSLLRDFALRNVVRLKKESDAPE